MRKANHVLWDWNGTLFDDAWLCVAAMNEMLGARGLPLADARRYEETFDFPVRVYYERIGLDLSVEPFERLAAEFMEKYASRIFECPMRAGADAALWALRDAGCGQSILSACEQGLLDRMVAAFPVRACFDRIAGLDDHYAVSKVDVGKQVIADLGDTPERILVVGDTVHDCEVAEALGARCVLIPSGHQSRSRLERCGVPVLDSLEQVPAFL